MSAGLPKRCGTTMALVFWVNAASTVSAVMFNSSLTSAKTGQAPTTRMGGTTLVQQKVGMMTSSPSPTSHARKAISRANPHFSQRDYIEGGKRRGYFHL